MNPLALVAAVLALALGGCGGAGEDGPPGGEPYQFEEWIVGVEYVVAVDLSGESRPATSSGLMSWSATVTSIEWDRETTTEAAMPVAVDPPGVGDTVWLAIRDTVVLGEPSSVVAVVNDLRTDGEVERLAQLVLDSNWEPLPGNLQVAVDGLEAAIADGGVAGRHEATIAVLEGLTR